MRFRALPVLVVLALAGCDTFDPFEREGTWRPAGVNEANLRAMLVEPDELFVGTSERGSDGQLGGAAVERLRSDQVRPLPVIQIVPIGGGGG